MLHLLRAGAALDGFIHTSIGQGHVSLEQVFERLMDEREDPEELLYLNLSYALVRAVRAAGGTWRQYVRQYVLATPKELLRLRALVARGGARVKVCARAKTPRPIAWLMSPNVPNEIAWRVLEFWNPRSDGTKYHREY